MARVPFETLPDHGRLWVFPASRSLSGSEREQLLNEVDAFLETWAAHGRPLKASRELRDDRFLVVGVDVDAASPSGCSIDALVNGLEELAERFGITLTDHAPVRYRDDGEIRQVSRPEFRSLAKNGRIGPDVRVFDTTLTTIAQLRQGGLEGRAADTWHGRAFFSAQLQ
ncbi:MAG: hypothetical protein U5R14_06335 [Gemmatimonadota bacterium]|nr:hypothetical protein [Gemmatimonadota bacterium]